MRARGSIVQAAGGRVAAPQPAAARAARARPARGAVGGRVPLAVRPACAVAAPPRPAVQHHHRGGRGLDRLRAGRVDQQPVRRQLQLARTGLVPRQLPVHRVAAALGRGPRRVVHGRVPDRLRDAASPARRGRGPRRSGSCPSGCRTRPGTGPWRAPRRSCATTRSGATCCCSTSTSTATPGRGSGPRTRPAGPASSPTCLCRGGTLDIAANGRPAHEPAPAGPPMPGGPVGVM